MRCPKCDRLPTAVLKTETPIDEGVYNIKRRRRRCRNCRECFYTFEVVESEFRKLSNHPDEKKITETTESKPLKSNPEILRAPLRTKPGEPKKDA